MIRWLFDILRGQSRDRSLTHDRPRYSSFSLTEGSRWRGILQSWGFGKEAAGVTINQDTAMNSATAFACTRARAEWLATLPAIVNESLDGLTRRRARQNPMWSLLHDQPNPQMDSRVFYSLLTKRYVNRGNGFAVIERNGRGMPVAIWPIHNSRICPVRLPSRQVGSRFFPGEIIWEVWPDDSNRSWVVPDEDVFNLVSFDTEDGVLANGVVKRLRQELSLDIAQQEYTGSLFGSGAVPAGHLNVPADIAGIETNEDRRQFRNDINAHHQGRENWNKILITWDERAKYEKIGFSPEDVQSVESRRLSARIICQGYDVPPAIVQIFDDFKFNTVEAMIKQFVVGRLRLDAVCWERAIDSQILNDLEMQGEDLFLEFALKALLRGSPKEQAETNAVLRSWGFINADEVRLEELGMNPLPDGQGQVYLAPLNYAPLDLIAEGRNLRDNSQSGTDGSQQGKSPRFDATWLAAVLGLRNGNGDGHATEEIEDGPSTGIKIQHAGFAEAVIADTVDRFRRREQNDLRRLLQTAERLRYSGFIDAVEKRYKGFESAFAEALTLGYRGMDESTAAEQAAQHAAAYCSEAKAAIIAAADELRADTPADEALRIINDKRESLLCD